MKFLNQIDSAEQLKQDKDHRLVTDIEKTKWNLVTSKADLSYVNTELNKKEIPTGAQAKATQALTDAKDYVDGKVKTNVPTGAIFTDTKYTHPATHPYSMITGAPTSLPASGGQSNTTKHLVGEDTRDHNYEPSVYMSSGSRWAGLAGWQTEFKNRITVDSPGLSGTYVYLQTHTPWSDSSGGYPVQIAYGNGVPHWRVGISNIFWGPWSALNDDGNAATVNGKTVLSNVPANAKFTDTNTNTTYSAGANMSLNGTIFSAVDTVYSHPSSHPASIIDESIVRRFVTDSEKATWNAKWNYSEDTIKAVKVSKAVDADTVTGKTVGTNVPEGAKFTDTIVDISGKADKTYVDEKVTKANVESTLGYNLASIMLTIYPVGSIYLSTVSTNPGTLFGGTWVSFGEGRTLVGVNTGDTDFNAANKTGGSKTQSLSVANLPSHNHTGSSNSTGAHTHSVTGTVASGGAHTHSISGTAASAGAHVHAMPSVTWYNATENSMLQSGRSYHAQVNQRNTGSAGAHTHSVSGTAASAGAHGHTFSSGSAASAGAHSHTITVGSTGSGTAHNNMQPYITTYMFRRTA